MGNKFLEIGPLEMEVLGLLNIEKELSVSELQAKLKSVGHSLAYTTVMTVLVRLYNKGHLQRRKEGRQYLYFSAKKKESASSKIFEKVKKSLFRAERLAPILSLLDSEESLTREELEELRKAVDAKLKGKA